MHPVIGSIQVRATIRAADDAAVKVPVLETLELAIQQTILNLLTKQNGGTDHALIEVNVEAERTDK